LPVIQAAYDRLLTTDSSEAWTAGLFMTERTGGSDVSGTETIATHVPLSEEQELFKDNNGHALGPWKLDGFKWFSSGTEAQVSILLARTPNGISAFYAPMRRETLDHWGRKTMELNGVHIQRLKSKIGTRPNTTAELEIKGMRAWLLGDEGKGVRSVVVVLTITRLHVAINALGYWARGLAASRAFARVRKVARGATLVDVPLHMAALAREHIQYRAAYMLVSFAGALLGRCESDDEESEPSELIALVPERKHEAQLFMRVLASPIKAMSARFAMSGLAYTMEFLGGVGALENDQMDFNVARLYRDVSVMGIVDGTTQTLATDLIGALAGRMGHITLDVLDSWLNTRMPKADGLQSEWEQLSSAWKMLRKELTAQPQEYLLTNAIEIMENFYAIFAGAVLLADANIDMDPVAVEVVRRWLKVSFTAKTQFRQNGDSTQLGMNQLIVFGEKGRLRVSCDETS
jgi:alkylation response protein AidB-like acyl-CoA dehydrogenase